jgi:hypothetical protein
MAAYFAILIAFLAGALGYAKTRRKLPSWLASCCVVPVFVLFAEFILPYKGGGASMWPIALMFGGARIGGSTTWSQVSHHGNALNPP